MYLVACSVSIYVADWWQAFLEDNLELLVHHLSMLPPSNVAGIVADYINSGVVTSQCGGSVISVLPICHGDDCYSAKEALQQLLKGIIVSGDERCGLFAVGLLMDDRPLELHSSVIQLLRRAGVGTQSVSSFCRTVQLNGGTLLNAENLPGKCRAFFIYEPLNPKRVQYYFWINLLVIYFSVVLAEFNAKNWT